MIDIKTISKKDRGRWVEYKNSNGKTERGKIKGFNPIYIFVVYYCDGNWNNYRDYTGIATYPSDLTFIDDKIKKELADMTKHTNEILDTKVQIDKTKV